MTQRQQRSTTTPKSITLNSGLCTREAILVVAKGISNPTIVWALGLTQINLELVSNKGATRFDEVTIVEQLNRNIVVADQRVCWLGIWI